MEAIYSERLFGGKDKQENRPFWTPRRKRIALGISSLVVIIALGVGVYYWIQSSSSTFEPIIVKPAKHRKGSSSDVVKRIYELMPGADPNRPIVIAFTMSWCQHCHRLAPIWEKVEHNMTIGATQIAW